MSEKFLHLFSVILALISWLIALSYIVIIKFCHGGAVIYWHTGVVLIILFVTTLPHFLCFLGKLKWHKTTSTLFLLGQSGTFTYCLVFAILLIEFKCYDLKEHLLANKETLSPDDRDHYINKMLEYGVYNFAVVAALSLINQIVTAAFLFHHQRPCYQKAPTPSPHHDEVIQSQDV